MDKSIRRLKSDTQQANGFLDGLQIIKSILHWLAEFTHLTEDEQGEAGVYIGNQYSR
jgi:hypothetical protein